MDKSYCAGNHLVLRLEPIKRPKRIAGRENEIKSSRDDFYNTICLRNKSQNKKLNITS